MMPGDSEIIKEFLVSVGVTVDQGAISKLEGAIGTITKGVFTLGATLLAGAVATEKYVDKIATKFEDLYWTSKRLKSSVSDIQDFGLAIKNLGGNSEDAVGSLETLARNIRTNPGIQGLLSGLGINAGGGAVNISKQLAGKLKSSGMPYFVAAQYAETLGIDEGTFWAEWNAKASDLDKKPYAEAYKKANVNADDLAKKSQNFEVTLRVVGVIFDVMAASLQKNLLPAADAINKKLIEINGNILKTTATGQKEDNIFDPSQYSIPHSLGEAGDKAKANFGRIGKIVGGAVSSGIDWLKALAIRENFEGLGWSKDDAAAIAAQAMAESGGNAKLPGDHGHAYGLFQWQEPRQANFKKWAGFDIHDPRADFQKQIEFANYELTQGSEAKAGKLLRAAKTAAEKGAILSKAWMRPAAIERDAANRAGIASKIVTLNSKTDIHVASSPTAAATAKKVTDQQTRVNGDLVRNLKPVIQ